MQIVDLENQSLVGTVIVIEAIVSELLVEGLRPLAPADRAAALERIAGQVAANGKAIIDLAPKAQLGNAQKIQAAAARMIKAASSEALAELSK